MATGASNPDAGRRADNAPIRNHEKTRLIR